MKILVTGREGQLARSLLERGAGRGVDLIVLGRPELDLERPDSLVAAVARVAPDIIVSAAAYTAVDQAEDEPERAEVVNGEAPGVLAEVARQVGARIIHLSTDYVFDGSSESPYGETAPTGPIGVYGRTKLAGEEAVRRATPDHLILRTAWVYSPFGRNFVRTMMKLAESRDTIDVVADQRGNPSSALDVADALLAVIEAWRGGARTGLGETYHLAGTGDASWAEFAEAVMAECARRGLPSAKINPIPSSAYPTRAHRPAFSMLDSSKFERDFGFAMPDWRASLARVVERLAGERR